VSDDPPLRVAVVGAGALGTLLGAGLARAGDADVHLLHHNPEVAATISGGVDVREPDGRTWSATVEASADPESVGVTDCLLVVVRSYQTAGALADAAACVGPETCVLTLQNGITPYETVRDAVGDERVLGGVTYQGADLVSPGVVRHTADGPTTFGGPDRAFADRVEEGLEAAGFGTAVVDDPLPVLWEKQLVSAAVKPLAAVTWRTNGALVADPEMRAVMERVVAEVRVVAAAEDVALPDEDVVARLRRTLAASTHRSSMLQDVAAGRRTEVDAVNGAVVDRADAAGVAVPYNRVLSALVHGVERRYLEDDADPTGRGRRPDDDQ
jgi:2-dehydropantoate 2-reductase